MQDEGKLTPYHWKLLLFLSVATFFEGYDFLALTQILPNLRADMDLPLEASGYLIGFINIGTVAAFWIVRRADVWGRKKVLTITIVGYTSFTFLSGLAPDVYTFAISQLLARIFLLGEWAISMVIAAEEFPAKRRGIAMGVIQACSSLGSIACAGTVPFLLTTEYGWRTVYFIGILPLIVLMIARRGMRETARFTAIANEAPMGWFEIWTSGYAKRLLILSLIWFVAYIPAANGVAFWKEFAVGERGFTDADVGMAITLAAVGSMPFVFASGWLIDWLGRKKGGAIIFLSGCGGIFSAYTLDGFWPLTVALGFGIFAASAYLPVLNAYSTELFPTKLRGMAFAWCNNLLGRISYVGSPAIVGVLVGETGTLGNVVAPLALFNIVAVVLIFTLLPETGSRSLEDTAAMEPKPSSF